jgi:hypothetical protein
VENEVPSPVDGVRAAQHLVQPLFSLVFLAIGSWVLGTDGFGFFPTFLLAMGAILGLGVVVGLARRTQQGSS